MASIENLPFELIERILIRVPKPSVLENTAVSKRFLEVITNSIHLMDRVNFEWGWHMMNDIDKVLESSRKYRSLSVREFKTELKEGLLKFIDKNKTTLRKLAMHHNDFGIGTFQKIIEMVGSNLIEMRINLPAENYPEVSTLEMPNLKRFYYTHDHNFCVHHLMRLLKKLKNLEVLFLENCFLHSEDLQTVLVVDAQKLTFRSCSFEHDETYELQPSYQLEELTVVSDEFSDRDEGYPFLDKILVAYPNLTTLEFQHFNVSFETCLVLAIKAKKLKTLRLECSSIEAVTIPTIESFESWDSEIESDTKFIRVNRQLKKVRIDSHAEEDVLFQRALLENPSLEIDLGW